MFKRKELRQVDGASFFSQWYFTLLRRSRNENPSVIIASYSFPDSVVASSLSRAFSPC